MTQKRIFTKQEEEFIKQNAGVISRLKISVALHTNVTLLKKYMDEHGLVAKLPVGRPNHGNFNRGDSRRNENSDPEPAKVLFMLDGEQVEGTLIKERENVMVCIYRNEPYVVPMRGHYHKHGKAIIPVPIMEATHVY